MPFNDVVRQRLQPVTAALTSHFFLYTILSTVAVSAAIASALKNHSNFYSVTIYLSKSSRSVLILANFCFLVALLCGRIMQQIFLGPLQAREVERLYDRLWFFVTESLLAFTIFRDEFDVPFAFMFGFLLFIKCFHWLMADRIETMDQVPYPGPPLSFHIRMNCLSTLLSFTDFVMFVFAVESTLSNGVGGTMLFASEYAILMASCFNAMAKYVLSVLDLRRARSRGGANAPPWENKSMYVFYVELATDFLKLTTYLTFCALIITFYGLPLNIIRDVYVTSRSFLTRLRALHRYHTATRNMDERYPNASEEEMAAMSDRTCIICREEMILSNAQGNAPAQPNAQAPGLDGPNTTPKKLPCGHIFHFHCLRSWLERQQSCPTCRRTVLETDAQADRDRRRRNGRPPQPPQPGAAPIPPALQNWWDARVQNGGQAQGQAGQVNQGGFFGRLFGGAAQPPLVPGQFGHPPFQQPVGPPLPPPPGQEWWPYGQHPTMYPYGPPPALQPPPIFHGFYGPGGAWQPWGMDQRWFQAQAQVPVQGPNQQAQSQAPTGERTAPTAPAPSDPTTTQPAPIPTGAVVDRAEASSQSPAAAQNTDISQPSTPRDAAALAALRRFNSSRQSNATSDTPSSSFIPTATAAPSGQLGDTGSLAPGPPQLTANIPREGTSSESVPSRPSAPAPNTDARLHVPSLIPIYDFGAQPRSGVYTYPVGYSGHSIPPPPYPGHQSTPYRPSSAGRGQPTSQQAGSSRTQSLRATYSSLQPSRPQRTQSRSSPMLDAVLQPLQRLPETVSEEQLNRLDRLTREAIDERIRVLEGVQGTMYRCIEELMRVRSVLPAVRTETRRDDERPRPAARHSASAIPSTSSTSRTLPNDAASQPSAPTAVAAAARADAVSSTDVSGGESVEMPAPATSTPSASTTAGDASVTTSGSLTEFNEFLSTAEATLAAAKSNDSDPADGMSTANSSQPSAESETRRSSEETEERREN